MKRQKSWGGKTWSVRAQFDQFDQLKRALETDFSLPETPSHDPNQLCDMPRAVERITQAIAAGECLMVFGDFDADGVTSTAMLVDALRRLGAKVSYRIPDRATDSHGLKPHLVESIQAAGTDLIITVDCGINDARSVNHAQALGVDVIVTDHHQSDPSRFPDQAIAVINPHRADCLYPEKNLSGAGVVFKLLQALTAFYFPPDEAEIFCQKYLDLLAIGMIADCMPLTGEVRTLVKQGLTQLKQTQWTGLKALLLALKIEPENINEDTVGFYIGPVINAASRLGDVQHAVQLFLSDNDPMPRVQHLLELNDQRKQWSEAATIEAEAQVDLDQPFQLIETDTWPIGVLGLVAGRLAEKYQQPVIVMRDTGEYYQASCRSPEWADIEQALRHKQEIFDHVGGHRAAAGFALPKDQKPTLIKHLTAHYQACLTPGELPLELLMVTPNLLTLDLVHLIESLAPFGIGARGPSWLLSEAKIIDYQWIGRDKTHVRIDLKSGGKNFTALAFRAEDWKEKIQRDQIIDIHFTLRRQVWRGQERLQLLVSDIR